MNIFLYITRFNLLYNIFKIYFYLMLNLIMTLFILKKKNEKHLMLFLLFILWNILYKYKLYSEWDLRYTNILQNPKNISVFLNISSMIKKLGEIVCLFLKHKAYVNWINNKKNCGIICIYECRCYVCMYGWWLSARVVGDVHVQLFVFSELMDRWGLCLLCCVHALHLFSTLLPYVC